MKSKVRTKLLVLVSLIAVAACASLVYSHCQIPCGIYGDPARFDAIEENIKTIEKSIKQINELSAAEKPDMNQIVRWVQNKEKHADDTAHIITYYFMAQRIKIPSISDSAAQPEYVKKLTLLHKMLVYTMKSKQSADLANVEELRKLLANFHDVYFGSDKVNK
ncbi:MAG: superoxide dismutase [Ni] [Planctomycetota bacterium]|jgi:nickel superoxide dismutase